MNKTEYFCDIMNAYLNGKTIQYQNENGEWIDCNGEDWDFGKNYRIKKKLEPFENAHECFEEMQKHPPIGWLRQKQPRNYVHISYISTCLNLLSISYCNTIKIYSMEECLDLFEFIDGAPFGKNNTM